MGDFKEHGLMLFLSPQLYLGFIQFQADRKLGRSYAGLNIFNEGEFHLGLITQEEYEANKVRYSRNLEDQQNKPLTLQQVNEKKELERWTKTFSMVLDQWEDHSDIKWRSGWIARAQEWKDRVPNAKYVLALANGENHLHMSTKYMTKVRV